MSGAPKATQKRIFAGGFKRSQGDRVGPLPLLGIVRLLYPSGSAHHPSGFIGQYVLVQCSTPLAGDRTRAPSRGGIVDGAAGRPASNRCSQAHCPRVPEFFVAIASYE